MRHTGNALMEHDVWFVMSLHCAFCGVSLFNIVEEEEK